MHGQVSILEAISTIIILLISLNIFFPAFHYESRWDDVLLLIRARDIITTADRMGILHKISFNRTALLEFLDRVKPLSIISWSNVDSKIKRELVVSCNCTQQQIDQVSLWTAGLKINGIDTIVRVYPTSLDLIEQTKSDVLLIFGNKSLSNYLNNFRNYLNTGSGIILVGDPSWQQVQTDAVYRDIFGLTNASTNVVLDAYYDMFENDRVKPSSIDAISYEPWKYFYHVPVLLVAVEYSGQIPVEGLPQPDCIKTFQGSLKIQACNITETMMDVCNARFWICDSVVYFDTDWNGVADKMVQEREYFNITDINDQTKNFTFYLSYTNLNLIGVSFKPPYKFYDFVKWNVVYSNQPKGNPPAGATSYGLKRQTASYTVLAPTGAEYSRVLMQLDGMTANNEIVPAALLNSTANSRVAWIANFTEEGVGDDERLLLTSLILWASNRKAETPSIYATLGYQTSYLNVMGTDMFEPYTVTLGLGYPK
jgi:hypothetical protein